MILYVDFYDVEIVVHCNIFDNPISTDRGLKHETHIDINKIEHDDKEIKFEELKEMVIELYPKKKNIDLFEDLCDKCIEKADN